MTAYLCDTNVWLALALSGHRFHSTSRRWLDTIDTPASLFFCRATQQSLLRLLTNSAVLAPYGNPPLTNTDAWAVYEALIGDDRVAFLPQEPDGLTERWRRYALRPSSSPKLWMDGYLAALAKAAGLTLVTTDTDFRQFRDLEVVLLS